MQEETVGVERDLRHRDSQREGDVKTEAEMEGCCLSQGTRGRRSPSAGSQAWSRFSLRASRRN